MAFADYGAYDGLGLGALVREGRISALDLVDEAIARIERVNPRLSAVATPLFDRARDAARGQLPDGPFKGVPFLLKDNGSTLAGVPHTQGSRFFAGYVPREDSLLIRRHRAAGLVFVGKTSLPELGLLPCTESALYGATPTPWKAGFTAGGSSGGSAASVAAGLVPMAHGSDGGGSLRIPASCCGVFALKPTRGRMPVGPGRSDAWLGLVVEHAVTRSVRDSAALLDVTHGAEATAYNDLPRPARPLLHEVTAPPGSLRVAVVREPFVPGTVHPDCLAALDDAVALLTQLGHRVEETTFPIDARRFSRDLYTLVCADAAAAIDAGAVALGRRATARDFEPGTWLTAVIGRQQSGAGLLGARERLLAAGRRAIDHWAEYDVVLSPTLAQPPARFGALLPAGIEAFAQRVIARAGLGFLLRIPGLLDPALDRIYAFLGFPALANVSGQPSMSVPLWWNADGLPVGTMFTGRMGDEATLFRLAGQLEAARPWATRRPAIHADA